MKDKKLIKHLERGITGFVPVRTSCSGHFLREIIWVLKGGSSADQKQFIASSFPLSFHRGISNQLDSSTIRLLTNAAHFCRFAIESHSFGLSATKTRSASHKLWPIIQAVQRHHGSGQIWPPKQIIADISDGG